MLVEEVDLFVVLVEMLFGDVVWGEDVMGGVE